jgi:hypothetical protein
VLRSIQQIVFLSFVALPGLCPSLSSAGNDSAATPLSPAEKQAVIGEIQAMVKTRENDVGRFVVREATPERIDRLYRMPELANLSTTLRENGLIFAGRGSTLTFDKPSDIINKISAWFPDKVAASRKAKDPGFFGRLDLHGPYLDWNREPTAFIALWECMPQIAWLKPDANPFQRRWGDGLPFWQNAAQDSGHLDFGYCVRERTGYRPGWTQEALKRNTEEARLIGLKATPVLSDKFEHFLKTQRCTGTGPDDCVLTLWMWSSLSPADARLASAIRTLEADVHPTENFPPLKQDASVRAEVKLSHRADRELSQGWGPTG